MPGKASAPRDSQSNPPAQPAGRCDCNQVVIEVANNNSLPAMAHQKTAPMILLPVDGSQGRVYVQSRDFLKIMAMVTMVIDHTGILLFPDVTLLRYIGRLAFPIYAYLIATGFHLTRNQYRYLHRLLWLAILSQFGRAVALGGIRPWHELNIIFTFAVAVIVAICWDRGFWGKIMAIPIFFIPMGHIETGLPRIIIVLAFLIMEKHRILGIVTFLTASALFFVQSEYWLYWLAPVAALPIILFPPKRFPIRVPASLWRYFYPVHWWVVKGAQLAVRAVAGS